MNEKEHSTFTVTAKDFILLLIFVIFWGIAAFCLGRESADSVPLEQKKEQTEAAVQLDTLDEWTTFQMAMVMTESRFNPEAVGTSGDWGIFQITDIYSREVNRILKDKYYSHEDAFDIQKSIEMFGVMQAYYNPEQDINKALRYHNKAGWYAKRVKDNIVFIQRMEEVRKALKENRERELNQI